LIGCLSGDVLDDEMKRQSALRRDARRDELLDDCWVLWATRAGDENACTLNC